MCLWGTAGGSVCYKCTASGSVVCVYCLHSYVKHASHADAAIGCTAGSQWPVGCIVASLQGVAGWAPHAAVKLIAATASINGNHAHAACHLNRKSRCLSTIPVALMNPRGTHSFRSSTKSKPEKMRKVQQHTLPHPRVLM